MDYDIFMKELRSYKILDWWPDDWRWDCLAEDFEQLIVFTDSLTDITNKLYRDFKANDINIDKSKRLLLDGITNSVIKGYLSSFQGEHYYQWIKKRKILEVLAEFDIGESTWEEYVWLIEHAFEKGAEFGSKNENDFDLALKKYKQWIKGKAYTNTLNRRAKKTIRASFEGWIKEAFLTGYNTKARIV
jgi:hypothetical protein